MRVLNSYEKTKERTVSVVEIQEFMEQQGNPVNVSTIYRNLDALVAQGQVMKFVSDKGDKESEIIKHIILDKNCFIMYVILCKLYKGG